MQIDDRRENITAVSCDHFTAAEVAGGNHSKQRMILKWVNKIHHGEALAVLRQMPSESVDCVLSSPPYWQLRDYGVNGQLGLESTPGEYLKKLCAIFDEVFRVLKKCGTCWVNIADTYSQSSGARVEYGKHIRQTIGGKKYGGHRVKGLLPKCKCLLPSRFAIEMCHRGWILRNEIIWYKPNVMPSPVKDRFTADFEKLFFFVKSQRYFFQQQFEPRTTPENRPDVIVRNREYQQKVRNSQHHEKAMRCSPHPRNKRCVWSILTQPFADAHFSVYPEKLCVTPILAGCPKGGIVLDPFIGSGTSAVVARKLGRQFIGIELNQKYIQIATKRLSQMPLLWEF